MNTTQDIRNKLRVRATELTNGDAIVSLLDDIDFLMKRFKIIGDTESTADEYQKTGMVNFPHVKALRAICRKSRAMIEEDKKVEEPA